MPGVRQGQKRVGEAGFNLILGRCPYTLRKYRAGGGDLVQPSRDRIDHGGDFFADGVPQQGGEEVGGAADGLCEPHTPLG